MTYRFLIFRAKRPLRGFTLMEMTVSLFIFTLMMASVAQVFATAFSGYRNTRAIQRDIENAQYAVNVMGKELRTSSVVSPATGSLVERTSITFFDHSQSKCFQYQIFSNTLRVTSVAIAQTSPPTDCLTATYPAFDTISTGVVTGKFQVTPSSSSSPRVVGKVTISLDISEGSNHHARIQTTVSLRDFGVIGF